MSASFDCPECGQPHKEVSVPSDAWGVFVSDSDAERIRSDIDGWFDEFGLRQQPLPRVAATSDRRSAAPLPRAVRCSSCGWIGADPRGTLGSHARRSHD